MQAKKKQMSFHCETCSEECSAADMIKHVSSTRHKSLKDCSSEEVLECESCSDTNVHQLSLLRFGGNSMALLCEACSKKEVDKPSTLYTITNGAILLRFPQYIKYRDAECRDCGSEKNINVSRQGNKVVLVCGKCLRKPQYEGQKFINEDDENFLYELLGEYPTKKEVSHSSGKPSRRKAFDRKMKPKGKGGLKAGPKGKGKTGGKEVLQSLEGGSEATVKGNKQGGRNGKAFDREKKAKPQRDLNGGSASDSTSRSAKGVSRDSKDGKAELGGSKNVKRSENSRDVKGPKDSQESKDSRRLRDSNNSLASKTSKDAVGDSNSKGSAFKNSRGTKREDSKDSKGSQHKPLKDVSGKGFKSSVPEKDKSSGKKDPKQLKKSEDSKSSGNGSKKDHTPAKGPETRNHKASKGEAPPKGPGDPQGTHITDSVESFIKEKFTTGKVQLSYNSLNEYYRTICYNLFLEELIDIETTTNFSLSKAHGDLHLSIPYELEAKLRLSEKMRTLGKLPYSMNQSLIIMTGLEPHQVSYGYVSEIDVSKRGKPMLNVKWKPYSWNQNVTSGGKYSLIPCSVPVSRILQAMARLDNPKFVSMLLGKEPIRQLEFRNRLNFSNDNLNSSQKVAIQSVLNNAITALQGPPGTGKTSTIYEIVLQLLDQLHTYPILVVAASNIAIDNIAEKLLENHKDDILRITANEKEQEYNRSHPLADICLHHKVYDFLPQQMQQTADDLKRGRAHLVSKNGFKKYMQKQQQIQTQLVAQKKVIFTTTVVAGGFQLKSIKKLPVVIMDEATQSSEPVSLIPLSMPGVEKFVFVGDQKQLSSFARVPALQVSLFERILQNGTYRKNHMLDTQYRMHPAISEFPRGKFYDGLLHDGVTAQHRSYPGVSRPLLFYDTEGKCLEGRIRNRFSEDSGFSYMNRGEGQKVIKILVELVVEKGIDRAKIGIVTPYRAQRDLISSLIEQNDLINPERESVQVEVDRDDFFNESKPLTIHQINGILIASIDAFQGREKEFMVMSCVRSNERNAIGFVKDGRRMNVALTRAKMGLFIVGDAECLKEGDALWKEFLQSLEKKNLVERGDETEGKCIEGNSDDVQPETIE